MFFFQSMFEQVYNGITGSTTLVFVQSIAEGILLLAALFAVYEAYARGGDARALALAGVRYLIMALIISQYPNVFRAVNNGFNNAASAIAPTDVLTNYRAEVANYLGSPSGNGAWWNIITGDLAGAISLLFQLLAVLVFPITYVIFSFFYSMYGAVLYVCGPLVLALYPALGVGQLARTYMVNMLIWNAWGIIYAIMSQLLTIMSANSLASILTAQNFGGAFQGATQMLLISLSSILLSLMIALIPFIAKRVVSGDVGSTLFAVVGVAAAALQTAAVAVGGSAAGSSNGGNGGGGGGGGGGGAGVDVENSNRPPKPPDAKGPGDDADGPGGGEGSSQPPKGPGNDGEIRASSDGEARASSGGGAGVREAPDTHGAGAGGGGDAPHSRSTSRPRHRPHVSGLYHIPYGMAWAAGRTVRAVNDLFKSGNSEEA